MSRITIIGVDVGNGRDRSFRTVIRDGKIIEQVEVRQDDTITLDQSDYRVITPAKRSGKTEAMRRLKDR